MEETKGAGVKLLIVSRPYLTHRGGVELHAQLLASSLRSIGHQVDHVTPRRALLRNHRAYDWIILEGIQRPILYETAIRRKVDSRTKVAIFTHGALYEFLHDAELRATGMEPYPRGHALKLAADRLWMSNILRACDLVIGLSTKECSELEQGFDLNAANLRWLPNSGRPTLQMPDPSDDLESDLKSYSPFICAVGRVDRRKNFRVVVEAMEGEELTFLLAGADVRGEVREVLRVAATKKVKNFRYLGPIPERVKSALIRASIGTILPSFFEGSPYSVLESLQLGKPAICTRASYMPAWEGVILCDPTLDSVRVAIQRLASDPPAVPAHISLPTADEVAQRLDLMLDDQDRSMTKNSWGPD